MFLCFKLEIIVSYWEEYFDSVQSWLLSQVWNITRTKIYVPNWPRVNNAFSYFAYLAYLEHIANLAYLEHLEHLAYLEIILQAYPLLQFNPVWNSPPILQVHPALQAHPVLQVHPVLQAPPVLQTYPFLNVHLVFQARAQPDWAHEFPDRTGPDTQICWTGPAVPD